MTTLLMLLAFAACKLEIVPTAVTLPSQSQFQFRTKVHPVQTCSQAVTCKTTAGTITADTCILVAPRIRKTTVVTVTAVGENGQKASARVTVEGEGP